MPVRAPRARPLTRHRKAPTPAATLVAAAPKASADTLPGVSPTIRAKLAKLGIASLADALLHLPLRYEDETKIQPVARARDGRARTGRRRSRCQRRSQYRPRRRCARGSRGRAGRVSALPEFLSEPGEAVGARRTGALLRRDTAGFLRCGDDPPAVSRRGGRRAAAGVLTPVYPTTAGVAQDALRRVVGESLARCHLGDTLPEALRTPRPCAVRCRVRLLHSPAAGDVPGRPRVQRSHPAWRRIKFDELLAQQLSMRAIAHTASQLRAPPLPALGHLPPG